jgi:hypothetical protein
VLDRCSTSPSTRSSAAFTPHQAVTEPQLRPLPAGFVLVCSTWTHRHHARPQDPARHRPVPPRPDDPIIATSRWGRLAHQPPHCSPMGISWGSSPQGSPLTSTNHPR